MGGRHHQKYKDVKYISKYRYLRTFTHPFNLLIIVQRVRVRAWAKQRGGGGGGERQEKERSSRSALVALNEGLTLETSDFESLYGEQFTLSTQLIWPNYFPLAPLTPTLTKHRSFLRNLPPSLKKRLPLTPPKKQQNLCTLSVSAVYELSVFYLTKRYTVNRGRFTVLTAASLPFIFCHALFASSHSVHVTVILCHINSNQVPSHVFNLRFI